MKKTFPSFDLGIDHLFPSEPEESKQKKEEQQLWPRSRLGFREETQNYAKRNRSQIFF